MTGLPRWARGPWAPSFCDVYPPEVAYPYGPGPGTYGGYPPFRELSKEDEIRMLEEELSGLEEERDVLLTEIENVGKEIERLKKGGE